MIIEKISIKSFGALTDTVMEFSDKVNVIEGENESGKSTVAAFIRFMLYGLGMGDDKESVSERRKRINWSTGTAQGSMNVRVGDKRYAITRSTVMNDSPQGPTYKEDCAIVDLETGAPAFGKSPAGEVFFGVDRELFQNTAFIGSLAEARIDEDTVKTSIENILFSGSEKLSSQKAREKIYGKMESLLHQSGTGGIIVDLMKKEDDLEAELAAANESNAKILAKEAELHEIKMRKEEIETKREKLLDLDHSYNNVMLIQTFDRLHELEKESEEKNDAWAKFIEKNQKNGFTPDASYLENLAAARTSLAAAEDELREAEKVSAEKKSALGITTDIENAIALCDTMQGESSILAEASGYQKKAGLHTAGLVVSALALLFGVIFEIIAKGTLATLLFRILFGTLAGSGLVLGVLSLVFMLSSRKKLLGICAKFETASFAELYAKISHIADARNHRDITVRESNLASTVFDRAKERYENAGQTLTSLVLKWSDGIPEEAEPTAFLDGLDARAREYIAAEAAKREERDTLDITVKEIRRTLSDTSEIDIRAQVSPLRRKALQDINHDNIKNEIAACRLKIQEEDDLARRAEEELLALKAGAKDPGELVSRIRVLSDRIAELQARHKAYFLAHKMIESAEAQLRTEITPRLGGYATDLMSEMTERKYQNLDVSEGMKVTFTSPTGETLSVDFLSSGTQDLTYIAVRLALIDMLYNEKPPISFDESFAHQDNNRAAGMMRAIKRLSDDGQQSFVFTCRSREATLAADTVKGAAIFKLRAAE